MTSEVSLFSVNSHSTPVFIDKISLLDSLPATNDFEFKLNYFQGIKETKHLKAVDETFKSLYYNK